MRVPETKPLIEWFCQPVALAISAIVAPSLRRRRSRMICFLLPSRGWRFSGLGAAALDAFLLAGFASFLAAAFLAPFWPLGAPLLLVAFLVEVACFGAAFAPCSATAAVSVWVASLVFIGLLILSAADPRMTIHH